MKKWIYVVVLLLDCFALAQLIRPKIDNPPVTADIGAPAPVEAILRRGCYDCHSNETHLLWFDKITPANFIVASHIKDGRAVLNFSNWDSVPKPQRLAKLYESLNQATFNVMPLADYLKFHAGAKITDSDIAVLQNYLISITPVVHPDTAINKAADLQYTSWLAAAARTQPIPAEFNGINYPMGFDHWQVISTTNRFDNGTLRVIYGNPIAVQAIAAHHTQPWPDGAIFAKAAWEQRADSTGIVKAGSYKQVEFMIKDQAKYASTGGWGFARWVKGTSLTPYGKDATFTTDCMNCHASMQPNDRIFTIPMQPHEGLLITSGLDKQKHQMFSLYGNEMAVAAMRSAGTEQHPAGTTLTLVTYAQRPDPHWFGGNIPDQQISEEKVAFTSDGKGGVLPTYTVSGTAPGAASERLAFILGLRASVVPK